jgi:hypothetical protein
MRSWRADSLCLRMARSRNYPMLQNYFHDQNEQSFFAVSVSDFFHGVPLSLRGASSLPS